MPILRVLSEDQVKALADLPSAWAAVEQAYREFALVPHVQSIPSIMRIPGPRPHLGNPALGQYRVKGASVPIAGAAGAFLSARDYGYMFLWSTETDEPIGLVACDWLSQFRVAVTMGVAVRALANPEVKKIAFFGAGKYGLEGARLLAAQWPDAEFVVVATSQASAERFAAEMPRAVGAGTDAGAAALDADVIVTITNAPAPFLEAGWVKPGALVLSMGSAHELHVEVLRAADALVVDDLSYACTQGDLAAWIRRGEVDEAELPTLLRANIGEVVAGVKPGRKTPQERIVAIIQGLTACDVGVAKSILDQANITDAGEVVRA
jgi:alanine dehydrogenase